MSSQPRKEATPSQSASTTGTSWRTFVVAFASGCLLWLAFPPVGWWWLAWLAPAGWIWLIRQQQMDGARPYRQLYLAGLIHWLMVLHWVRLPHWSASFGWLALAAYLAAYLPAFVWLCRAAVHRLGLPVVVAAPVIWSGLELVRSYLLTGFSMGLLGHTQASILLLIQIADVVGAYGIAFAIVWVAACAASLIPINVVNEPVRNQSPILALLLALMMLAVVVGYGKHRLQQSWTDESAEPLTIALIQGSIDTTFERDNRAETLQQYFQLTREAIQQKPNVELIVWPESMYPRAWIEFTKPFTIPSDEPISTEELESYAIENERALSDLAKMVGRNILVGSPGMRYSGDRVERYNSAQWLAPDGFVSRYHKMHPVMFGEYLPGGEWFPWLYNLTPMSNGLTPGTSAVAFEQDDIRLCPNICYENTVPHLIRRQVRQLDRDGATPDALVTITNDGWFWGSSQLDFHLACGIMRSVELRRPQFIAANTGFSASIDAHGRVLSRGPRHQTGIIWAEARPWVGPRSAYERWGDVGAILCAVSCLAAAWAGASRRSPA